jgi:hypothetical protein
MYTNRYSYMNAYLPEYKNIDIETFVDVSLCRDVSISSHCCGKSEEERNPLTLNPYPLTCNLYPLPTNRSILTP